MLDGLELKISKSSNILVLISDPNLTPLPQASAPDPRNHTCNPCFAPLSASCPSVPSPCAGVRGSSVVRALVAPLDARARGLAALREKGRPKPAVCLLRG